VTAAACFLASKVEENPRNLQDFAFSYLLSRDKKKPEAKERILKEKVGFVGSPYIPVFRTSCTVITIFLPQQEIIMPPAMEKLLLAERAVLYTLGFGLKVDNFINVMNAQMSKLGISEDNLDEATTRFVKLSYHMILNRCMMENDECTSILLCELLLTLTATLLQLSDYAVAEVRASEDCLCWPSLLCVQTIPEPERGDSKLSRGAGIL